MEKRLPYLDNRYIRRRVIKLSDNLYDDATETGWPKKVDASEQDIVGTPSYSEVEEEVLKNTEEDPITFSVDDDRTNMTSFV